MSVRRLALLPLLLLALATPLARADAPAEDDAPPHPLPVFRSVLDGNARMVTVPLHKDMWLAYDAQTCSLYKAWTGDVQFDGAVYTTVHGPQPTAQGAPYFVDRSAGAWHDRRGKRLQPRFLGYRIDDGKVTLRYRLRAGGRRYVIEETPTCLSNGNPILARYFHITPRPDPRAFFLVIPMDGVLSHESNTTLAFDKQRKTARMYPSACAVVTWISTSFDRARTLAAEDARVAAAVAKLLAEAKEVPGDAPRLVVSHPTDTPIGNGVSVRVYAIARPMSRLPKLIRGQTPNVSHILPVLDLRTERKDFGGVQDQFLTHVDGFLEIAEAGTYEFRLISDDGSRFFLDDKIVVDHDGLHGSTAMEGKTTLTQGRHKLFVEHFENGGGEQLTLEWRPPGVDAWAVVPNAVLRAPKGEVRVTSPGLKKIEDVADTGTPGDGKPLTGVHPAYDLMTLRPEGFEPRVGGMDWLPDGRLVICCWEPEGGVYVLDGVRGNDPGRITVKRIAAGLAEPLGLKVVDGRLYVLQKQELTELIDRDRDGLIDEYRTVAAGWGVTANFHEFAFGLVHKRGHFYATLATAINPGGASTQPQNPDRGKVLKIAPDGSFEFIAQGLRTPNGIGLGVDGKIFVTDNQGDWLPVSKLLHVRPGAFYGGRSVDFEGTEGLVAKPPVVWLPQGEIGNSPGEPGLLRGGPYSGQMLHADVTHGGLKRVFVERVAGQYQGCVFRFTQGLEAGINRWKSGPGGAIYVGGIGSAGNWGQDGKLKYGLQRLKPNGTSVFEMRAVRAMPTGRGFEIEFTEPLAAVSGDHPQDYQLQQWRYEPTKNYGGPKLDVAVVEITGVLVSGHRRRVYLQTKGLETGHVVHIRLARTIRTAQGKRPWSTEAWYTLSATPTDRCPGVGGDLYRLPAGPPDNALTEKEKAAGWALLFDGKSLDAWRGYKKEYVPEAWQADGGALHFTKQGPGGDIITRRKFKDFDLRLEWKVVPGGNSGVVYRCSEEGGAMWQTGPEMQVLDSPRHGDDAQSMHTAGANYALHAPTLDVTRPAGSWNQARVIVRGNHVEHWLNGWKVVAYELGSDDWKARLAASKFADTPGWGTQPEGHIGLQDHGNEVWYRNVKIRELK